jgi:hypothetical protein
MTLHFEGGSIWRERLAASFFGKDPISITMLFRNVNFRQSATWIVTELDCSSTIGEARLVTDHIEAGRVSEAA